ncbi:MAG TPA: Holliday junction resolvase-like protein [Blastocatellia bacterium]|nr:Holliday junction resolvase-like protein [Blastocatellia bacterium]
MMTGEEPPQGSMEISILLLTIICILQFLILCWFYQQVQRLQRELKIQPNRQRGIIKGQIEEQLYPLSDDCEYRPSQMRFMGNPIDFIVFHEPEGMNGKGDDQVEIVFLEIKTGGSRLSRKQQRIKQAVLDGRVFWRTICR